MTSILKKIFNSIALVPSGLALTFLLLGIILTIVPISYSDTPILRYLSIEDKEDTQTILSYIIGGIFTLTVFSYTMVMNVLNRNINNYSPRLIPLLLSQKHHQIILGFTSGTIMYALTMSLSLNNSVDGYFPTIAGGLGIIFSMISVFLFIYFLHTVSQSVHINHILKNVYDQTILNLDTFRNDLSKFTVSTKDFESDHFLQSPDCGYLHYIDFATLVATEDIEILFLKKPGEFIYENDRLCYFSKAPSESLLDKIISNLVIDEEVPLDIPETGFKHLVEVILKGSSPAINDPGTSMAALHYLTQLLIKRIDILNNEEGLTYSKNGIYFKIIGLKNIIQIVFSEIYHYCHMDPVLHKEIEKSLFLLNEKAQFNTPITTYSLSQNK